MVNDNLVSISFHSKLGLLVRNVSASREAVTAVRASIYFQTIEDIDHHLDFAIKRYHDSSEIRFAVNKVQTKVRLLHWFCGRNANLCDFEERCNGALFMMSKVVSCDYRIEIKKLPPSGTGGRLLLTANLKVAWHQNYDRNIKKI